ELRTALPFASLYCVCVALLTHGEVRSALLAVAPWWLLLRVNGAARSVFTVAERVGAEAAATVVEASVSLAAISLVLVRSGSPSARCTATSSARLGSRWRCWRRRCRCRSSHP